MWKINGNNFIHSLFFGQLNFLNKWIDAFKLNQWKIYAYYDINITNNFGNSTLW